MGHFFLLAGLIHIPLTSGSYITKEPQSLSVQSQMQCKSAISVEPTLIISRVGEEQFSLIFDIYNKLASTLIRGTPLENATNSFLLKETSEGIGAIFLTLPKPTENTDGRNHTMCELDLWIGSDYETFDIQHVGNIEVEFLEGQDFEFGQEIVKLVSLNPKHHLRTNVKKNTSLGWKHFVIPANQGFAGMKFKLNCPSCARGQNGDAALSLSSLFSRTKTMNSSDFNEYPTILARSYGQYMATPWSEQSDSKLSNQGFVIKGNSKAGPLDVVWRDLDFDRRRDVDNLLSGTFIGISVTFFIEVAFLAASIIASYRGYNR